jgi:hypothetical protein
VEHLRDELHAGRLVRVGFFEVHDEFEGAVFEGRVLFPFMLASLSEVKFVLV